MFGRALLVFSLIVFTGSVSSQATPFYDFKTRLQSSSSFREREWLEAIQKAENLFSMDSPDAEDVLHLIWEIKKKVYFSGSSQARLAVNEALDRIRDEGHRRLHDADPGVRLLAVMAIDATRGAWERDVRAYIDVALKDPAPQVRQRATNWLWDAYFSIAENLPIYRVPKNRENLAYDLVRALIQVHARDADKTVRDTAQASLHAIERRILGSFLSPQGQEKDSSLVLYLRTLANNPGSFGLDLLSDIGSRRKVLEDFFKRAQNLKDELTNEKAKWEHLFKIVGSVADQWAGKKASGESVREQPGAQEDLDAEPELPLDWKKIKHDERAAIRFEQLKALLLLLSQSEKRTPCETVLGN